HEQFAVLVELEHLMALRRADGSADRSGRSAARTASRLSTAGCRGAATATGGCTTSSTCCRTAGRTSCRTSGPAALTWPIVVAVGDPDVVVAINEQAVRKHDNARAEALDQFAVLVEVQDGIEVRHLPCRRVVAAVRAAPIENPHGLPIAID